MPLDKIQSSDYSAVLASNLAGSTAADTKVTQLKLNWGYADKAWRFPVGVMDVVSQTVRTVDKAMKKMVERSELGTYTYAQGSLAAAKFTKIVEKLEAAKVKNAATQSTRFPNPEEVRARDFIIDVYEARAKAKRGDALWLDHCNVLKTPPVQEPAGWFGTPVEPVPPEDLSNQWNIAAEASWMEAFTAYCNARDKCHLEKLPDAQKVHLKALCNEEMDALYVKIRDNPDITEAGVKFCLEKHPEDPQIQLIAGRFWQAACAATWTNSELWLMRSWTQHGDQQGDFDLEVLEKQAEKLEFIVNKLKRIVAATGRLFGRDEETYTREVASLGVWPKAQTMLKALMEVVRDGRAPEDKDWEPLDGHIAQLKEAIAVKQQLADADAGYKAAVANAPEAEKAGIRAENNSVAARAQALPFFTRGVYLTRQAQLLERLLRPAGNDKEKAALTEKIDTLDLSEEDKALALRLLEKSEPADRHEASTRILVLARAARDLLKDNAAPKAERAWKLVRESAPYLLHQQSLLPTLYSYLGAACDLLSKFEPMRSDAALAQEQARGFKAVVDTTILEVNSTVDSYYQLPMMPPSRYQPSGIADRDALFETLSATLLEADQAEVEARKALALREGKIRQQRPQKEIEEATNKCDELFTQAIAVFKKAQEEQIALFQHLTYHERRSLEWNQMPEILRQLTELSALPGRKDPAANETAAKEAILYKYWCGCAYAQRGEKNPFLPVAKPKAPEPVVARAEPEKAEGKRQTPPAKQPTPPLPPPKRIVGPPELWYEYDPNSNQWERGSDGRWRTK